MLLDPEGWLPVTDLQPVTGPVVMRLPAEIDMDNVEHVGEQLCSAFTRGAAVVLADLTRQPSATPPGRAGCCSPITTQAPAMLRFAS
jgi:hypothetical protein